MLTTLQNALLSPSEMAQADQAAIASGVSGIELMAAAGRAVVDAIIARWTPCRVLVLCGPGNNGGDGFVVASLLRSQGWEVSVVLLGARAGLQGDAAWHAAQWQGAVYAPDSALLEEAELIVDAMFGAGLSRDIDGPAAALLREVQRRRLPVCAIDIPSGVDGATGQIRGMAVPATLTVTFFRKKPGHLLLPGRELCGELHVADIGIPDQVLQAIGTAAFENAPSLWRASMPWPTNATHKYHRGHVLVSGGAAMTGAARLAAMGAARMGAGLVTIASPPEAWAVYAAACLSIMVERLQNHDLLPALADARRNVLLLGPGAGASGHTRGNVLAAAATGRCLVLDADALSAFADNPRELFDAFRGPCVMTPHEGEFARLFNIEGDKLQRARRAAAESSAVVILKGSDTVIAEPQGRVAINVAHAPWLATGGTGDVLAGMVAGMCAQGMPAFDAACAAVWIHAEAGKRLGPGMMSEDLPGLLPEILGRLMLA